MRYLIQTKIRKDKTFSETKMSSSGAAGFSGSSGKSGNWTNGMNTQFIYHHNAVAPYEIPNNSTVGQVKDFVKNKVWKNMNNETIKSVILWSGNQRLTDDNAICPTYALELDIIF